MTSGHAPILGCVRSFNIRANSSCAALSRDANIVGVRHCFAMDRPGTGPFRPPLVRFEKVSGPLFELDSSFHAPRCSPKDDRLLLGKAAVQSCTRKMDQ